MKFCHVTTFFPPFHFGGDAVFVANLVNLLADAGHDVTVVHCRDSFDLLKGGVQPAPYPVDPRVNVHTISLGPLSPLLTHLTGHPVLKHRILTELLDGHDVIHWHNLSLIAGPGGLAIPRARQVATMHDFWLDCPMSVLFDHHEQVCETKRCIRCTIAQGRPPQLWRYTGLMARSLAKLHAIFAPSRFVAARAPFPTQVLPHFAPPPLANVPDGPRDYYFYAGRLERAKGLHTVLPFFSPSRPLIVAGDGSQAEALRRDAPDGVTFLGRVDRARLAALYRGARATIVPSICAETFGLTALESLQYGTPPIVSRFGALPEIVESTGCGWVYRDPAELAAVLSAVDDAAITAEPDLSAFAPEVHLRNYLDSFEAGPRL